MRKKITLLIGVLGIVITMFGAESNKVRIAFFPNITHSQALTGQADGNYQKALGKTKIEWKEFNAGSAEIEAFMANEVDIGFIGPGPAVNGFVKTRGELQIIAGAANGGTVFVSRKDFKVNKIGDLGGKKIAVPQYGNTQDIILRSILNKSGLKDTTKGGNVEILQAENADIKILLDQGKIDAAIVPEPWGTRLIKEVGANIILDYKNIWRNGDYSVALIIVRKEYAEKNKDIIDKFIKAHVDETKFINTNRDKAKELINSKLKEITGKALSNDVLELAFSKVIITNKVDEESVLEMVKLSQEAGYLRTVPNLKGLYDFSLLKKYTK